MTDTSDLEPKKVVRESYNRISRAYRGDAVSRDRGYFRWLAVLTPLLQPGDPVLDLGCGCGIPVAQELTRRFGNLDLARDLGRLHINISGCINACGHHHVGHIGILGVEKNGEEFYQITIGGRADEKAELGALIGPAVPYALVADVVEGIVAAYLELRGGRDESFVQTVKRLGVEPFRERVYATH